MTPLMNLRLDTAFGVSSIIIKSAVSAIQEYLSCTQAALNNNQAGRLPSPEGRFQRLIPRYPADRVAIETAATSNRHLYCKAQKDPAVSCVHNRSHLVVELKAGLPGLTDSEPPERSENASK